MNPLLEEILLTGGTNPFKAFWYIFKYGGGLIFIPVMIHIAWTGWMFWIQEKYKHHQPFILIKIEVPTLNEQNLKAVEQIFSHLYGALDIPNTEEKYWDGYTQQPFSFEIESNGGYITFYVRAPAYHREMVQAAFYAQYPDCVLTEVEDYAQELTDEMIVKDQIKMYASEVKLEKDAVYPIKTWPHWEHQLSGKAVDPLASLLEVMTRLQPGEHWWLQLMTAPAQVEHFKHKAEEAIMAVVEPGGAAHGHSGPDWLDKLLNIPIQILGIVHDAIWPGEYATESHEVTLAERQRLTNPERELVDELDRKMSRWPYEVKLRWVYWAPPKLFDRIKGRRGMLGALSQYKFVNSFQEGSHARVDITGLKFYKIMPARRVKYRARKMRWAYLSRDMERGEHEGFVLATEELASLFHFPALEVRAPFVTKATTRGIEPPSQLRYDTEPPGGGRSQVSFENDQTPDRAEARITALEPTLEPPAAEVVANPPTMVNLPDENTASTDIADKEAPSNLPFV